MSDRFSIRPYQLDDIDEVFAAVEESYSHVAPWMGWLTPAYTRADAATWVNLAVTTWGISSYEHLIIDHENGAIAGSCGLNSINGYDRFCNLSYWIRASYLRQGAAKAATLLLRDFGFKTVGLKRLEIVVAVGNVASQSVAKSAGAHDEGILKSRLRVGEIFHDAHMFALINE